MVRRVRIYPDPILREVAAPVDRLDDRVRALARDLIDTMLANEGLGLSSNQIGELLRVIAVYKGEFTGKEDETQILINPEVIYYEGEEVDEEGCLSFPGLYFDVRRPYLAVVKALELREDDLVPVEITATGLYARVLQHEIDHINGILYIDYLEPKTRAKKLREWKESLKKQRLST
ncbi:MAG: peptide deformylase [Thermotogae bacterium]|nr:peptide deformylase [Thermotogota bacterium]